MIVTADFMDHWKTQMLVGYLEDESAPCGLLRLWGHCQQRKTHVFEAAKLSPPILKAITRLKADAKKLWDAFIEAGFLLEHENGTVEASGFYDANAQLFANWENGKKGGRPKKEKPMGSPSETHQEPIEGTGGEKKEETDKQDEGEEKDLINPVSSPSCQKGFWNGKDYSKAEIPKINTSSDIFNPTNDPIAVCMALTGDHTKAMYGFLVKGLRKGLDAGLSVEVMDDTLREQCNRIFSELKAGERSREDLAKALVATMRDFFEML